MDGRKRPWRGQRSEGLKKVSEIFWIVTKPKVPLAVVRCPRGDTLLKPDLIELKEGGIDTLISLLERDEASWLGLAEEAAVAEQLGMQFLSFPIPDANIPLNPGEFRTLVSNLAERLANGERIGVHCRGCVGRSTVLTASVLIQLGISPEITLAAIEKARGRAVPDTPEQERWILRYQPVQ